MIEFLKARFPTFSNAFWLAKKSAITLRFVLLDTLLIISIYIDQLIDKLCPHCPASVLITLKCCLLKWLLNGGPSSYTFPKTASCCSTILEMWHPAAVVLNLYQTPPILLSYTHCDKGGSFHSVGLKHCLFCDSPCVSCMTNICPFLMCVCFCSQGARVVVSRSFADFTSQASFDIKVGEKQKSDITALKHFCTAVILNINYLWE